MPAGFAGVVGKRAEELDTYVIGWATPHTPGIAQVSAQVEIFGDVVRLICQPNRSEAIQLEMAHVLPTAVVSHDIPGTLTVPQYIGTEFKLAVIGSRRGGVVSASQYALGCDGLTNEIENVTRRIIRLRWRNLNLHSVVQQDDLFKYLRRK